MTLLIRSASLTGFADLARSLGLDPLRLATESGAPVAALTDPELKLASPTVAALLELTAVRSGVEDIGLRLAAARKLSNVGGVGLIARDQPTLRKAINVIIQYHWLHNEALRLTVTERDDLAIVRIALRGLRDPHRQAIELTVGVMCVSLRALMGPGWWPEAVLFRHGALRSTASHLRVFGRTPQFGMDINGLVLRRAELDLPLATDPGMARQVELMLATASQRRRSAVDETYELVALLLPTGICGANRVAAHLGIDRRTLHRRLAAEGSSYRVVQAAARQALVLALVADGRSLTSIADVAGFASPSAFSHWFRRRFGTAPRDWAARRDQAATKSFQAVAI